jgi:hypothetical protein
VVRWRRSQRNHFHAARDALGRGSIRPSAAKDPVTLGARPRSKGFGGFSNPDGTNINVNSSWDSPAPWRGRPKTTLACSSPTSNLGGRWEAPASAGTKTAEEPVAPSVARASADGGSRRLPSVASADFNGDHIPDLVGITEDPADPAGFFRSVLLGLGNGSFRAPILVGP